MTICIVSSNYIPSPGGIATFTHRLATLLQLQGNTVIVLTLQENVSGISENETYTEPSGVLVVKPNRDFYTSYTHHAAYFNTGGMDAPYWIALGKTFRRWLIENSSAHKINILEVSAFGGLASFFTDPAIPPVVLSGHGAFFQYKQYNNGRDDEQSMLIGQLERISFATTDAVIAHSPQSKIDIEKYTSRPVKLAPVPFLFREFPVQQNELSDRSYALVVGSLQRLKGPIDLCEAINTISGMSIEIIWAGSDAVDPETGINMSVLLSKRFPSIWGKQLKWINVVPDMELATLYTNAKFLIIPTLWESFNVISIEAAFYGKPAIITSSTGSSFLFKHKWDPLESTCRHASLSIL